MLLILTLAVTLFGCAKDEEFAGAPNIYKIPGVYPDANIPPAQRSSLARIYYVTDRAVVSGDPTAWEYGHERSASMSMGRVIAEYGEDVSWAQLKAVSAGKASPKIVDLKLHAAQELVRFTPTPLPFTSTGGVAQVLPEARKVYEQQREVFKQEIAEELRLANKREVILFVHGFANDFEDAGTTVANIWHYSGRIGMPMFYSWPGANPGVFGYFRDRESASFSVFHMKEFLRMLSEVPNLDKIHLLAHSLGTDITSAALRELIIAERAAGRNPRKTLKIENVIIAAPDLDFGVVTQRLIAEHFGSAFRETTVYMNPDDGALAVAQTIASGRRLGKLSPEDLSGHERRMLAEIENMNFVSVEQVGGSLGHSYFRKNPDVMSDVIRIIQTSAAPGSVDRPLEHLSGNFWRMHAGYPFSRPAPEPSAKEVVR